MVRGSGTLRGILERLRAGNVLAILPDVRMRTPGITVSFLGGEANLGPGAAAFARRAGVPVLVCMALRVGRDRHRLQWVARIDSEPSTEKTARSMSCRSTSRFQARLSRATSIPSASSSM